MDRRTLDDDELCTALERLPGWSADGGAIGKEFRFDTFMAGIAFVNRVASLAEAANHHPDLDVRYRIVRVNLSSHDAGGITMRDTTLAGEIEAAASGAP